MFPAIKSKINAREKRSGFKEFLEKILPPEPNEIIETFKGVTRIRKQESSFGLNGEIHNILIKWMYSSTCFVILDDAASTTGKPASQTTSDHIQGLLLNDETSTTIDDIFSPILSTPATEEEKAVLYMSLAFNFIYSSSSQLFGSESDSPTPLRIMGLALLNQAFSEISSLDRAHPLTILQESREDWGNRLMGVKDFFSCSAILSSDIFRQLNGIVRYDDMTHLQEILNIVIPEPWKR